MSDNWHSSEYFSIYSLIYYIALPISSAFGTVFLTVVLLTVTKNFFMDIIGYCVSATTRSGALEKREITAEPHS